MYPGPADTRQDRAGPPIHSRCTFINQHNQRLQRALLQIRLWWVDMQRVQQLCHQCLYHHQFSIPSPAHITLRCPLAFKYLAHPIPSALITSGSASTEASTTSRFSDAYSQIPLMIPSPSNPQSRSNLSTEPAGAVSPTRANTVGIVIRSRSGASTLFKCDRQVLRDCRWRAGGVTVRIFAAGHTGETEYRV